jgi:hypothetical protein
VCFWWKTKGEKERVRDPTKKQEKERKKGKERIRKESKKREIKSTGSDSF